MNNISNIIRSTLGENIQSLNFEGEVYFEQDGQFYDISTRIGIDRDVYNQILNHSNAAYDSNEDLLDAQSNILLIFIHDFLLDKSSFWEEKKLSYYNSLLILEEGIVNSFSEENLSKSTINYQQEFLAWDEIDQIELLNPEETGYFFRFYHKDKTSHEDIPAFDFCTSDLDTCQVLIDLFYKIAENRKEQVKNSISEHSELKLKIEKAFQEGDYIRTIEELEEFAINYEVEDANLENSSFYYIHKTLSFVYMERLDEALETIENYIKNCESVDRIEPYSYELKGEILLKKNQLLPAINYLAYSEENYETEDYKKSVRLLKEKSYSKLKEAFLEIPYEERKIIFVGEDIYATKSKEIVVLKKRAIPENIYFPIGHPHVNELYTCHPHKQNFYLPLKDYSEELFMDRINEFSYLLQCMGATKLEISSSKSDSSDTKASSKNQVDANIDYKINSAKVNYKGESTENTLIDGKLKIAKKQIFKPNKAPYIPSNLVWYHSDLNWQRLVDQRLNGSIITHSEMISSSQSENISSHELKKIDAELKLLLPKIGVSYSSENEITTSSIKTHEWIVTVEFEDVDKLLPLDNTVLNTDDNIDEYNSKLERYKEDVLLMIEDDGVIDDMERNILDRKIKKYGLSEEDAKAVESDLITSSYSESERNYIQELKEFLEDGGINDIERKILDRYALKFGIEKAKQMEIDNTFINPATTE